MAAFIFSLTMRMIMPALAPRKKPPSRLQAMEIIKGRRCSCTAVATSHSEIAKPVKTKG